MTTPSRAVAATNSYAVDPKLMKWRFTKDRLATVGVSLGGMGVIFAVVLIFFYLLWVVLPLFKPAAMDAVASYAVPGDPSARSLAYAVDEQAELALRISDDGELRFFDVRSGAERLRHAFGEPLTATATVNAARNTLAVLTARGDVHVLQHKYRLDYPEAGGRVITPRLEFPLGEDAIEAAPGESLAVREDEFGLTVAVASGQRILVRKFEKTTSFLSDSVTLEPTGAATLELDVPADRILVDPLQEWLYVFSFAEGTIHFYDIRKASDVRHIETLAAGPRGASIEAVTMLAGGISIVTASSDHRIRQWFPVRDDAGGYALTQVRSFEVAADGPVSGLVTESRRRGFMSLGGDGRVGVYYATSGREVMDEVFGDAAWVAGAVSPRADVLLLEGADGQMQAVELHNEHPEVSWSALWGKVWYESYPEPDYVWQSSSASGDHEPKFSLAPLSFGTLKAAFYAMLFAVPLAIGGAIYTAYFMSPGLRQIVKPSIEVMEALPTVILGFLAGLWLAPFVENNLPGVFLVLLVLPITMPLTGWAWHRAPKALRYRVSDGWQPALLILPIIIAAGLAILLSGPLEMVLFGGNMPHWLDDEMGITFDQRNSLVVGLAMGFAVIPTIFSIAEDAIFSVPKQLTQGSLALGATPWQTLVRVVLPTASPGIFSALMIGLGRAVGETMIVLMATGNTPIMDFNIFEGFRTLSANIAVEMPESEVGSTHFRILFLAGLVLFLFTFVVNTAAEVVRQRLRSKYSNL